LVCGFVTAESILLKELQKAVISRVKDLSRKFLKRQGKNSWIRSSKSLGCPRNILFEINTICQYLKS
jgi:hypothetical protein